MSLTTGSRLGPYEIVSPLGAGGMGEVYRARDTRLERTVAIKVLPAHLAESPDRRQRLEREARTVSQLNHPHICALYDVGHQDGLDFLVLEYLEGESLGDRLQKGSLPLDQALRYGMEIADALDKAHRHGIVHRDFKPANVMVTRSGAKLLDFGLAKIRALEEGVALSQLSAAATTDKPLTSEGALLGTFQYMAPEQLEGKAADARTDIFSFGMVLYEMVTGRRAFQGKNPASLISAIMSDEPPPITSIQPLSPPALDRAVKTCLAKDPDDRWQSAHDLASELRWIAESGSQPSAGPVTIVPRGRRERVAWGLAALLALTSAFLVVSSRRRESPARPLHSYLIAPEKTAFQMNGDQSAPIVVSPDGTQVAFGAGERLWVESLETGTVEPLAGANDARFPFWSADSRSIGFFAGGKLKTVAASGGPVKVLADAGNPRGGAWGPDGTIVFAPDIRAPLHRIPASGGAPAPFTTIDTSQHTTHRWPSFLPDGQHVLYLAANHANPRSDESGIYVSSLDGRETRRILTTYGSVQYVAGWLLYMRDTSLMAQRFDTKRLALVGEPVRLAARVLYDTSIWRSAFTASPGVLLYQVGPTETGGQLTSFDRTGRILGTVGAREQGYSPRLSPDGRRVAIVLGEQSHDIWTYDLPRGTKTRVTAGALPDFPVWSPDGSRLAYMSQTAPGRFVVATISADGSGGARVIFESTERIEPTDWSPDGRYLLVDKGNIGVTDIWVFPLADPSKSFSLVSTPFLERAGQFSADGRWVAYTSRESGRDDVYVTSFPSAGARWQVSAEGGYWPRWRRDGRELFFFSSSGEVMAAQVRTDGARFEVADVKRLFRPNVYYGPRYGFHMYDVAADGERILVYSMGDVDISREAVVTNWMTALKP